jgi:hypothetical protein
MTRADWNVANFSSPGPSVRREDGIRDARNGRPRISNDRHYVIGYDLGNRLKPAASAPQTEAGTKGETR